MEESSGIGIIGEYTAELKLPKIIHLSVGGAHFTTSLTTLNSDPNSMLSAMFSGRHNLSKDEEGSYFVDRDGTHFRYILNYLRDGNAYIPMENQELIDELYEEVCFYQISGLKDKLEDIKSSHNQKRINYIKFLELINMSHSPLQSPFLRLTNIKLATLDLSKTNFFGSDFSGSDLSDVNLTGANLTKCTFDETILKNINLKEAKIDHCSFIGSILTCGNLRSVVARETNFQNARMAGCDLRESDCTMANFTGTVLKMANFDKANLFNVIWTGANIDLATFKNAKGFTNEI